MTQEEPVTGATTRIGYRWKICLVRASKHLLVCQNEGGGRGKEDKELLCGILRPPAGVVQKGVESPMAFHFRASSAHPDNPRAG